MNPRKVVKKVIPTKLFKQVEPYGHKGETMLWQAKYGYPAKGLNVIGITGTNGKTSTAFLAHNMLNKAGYKVGLMTTVAYGVGDNLTPQVAHMTTVSPSTLLSRIKAMRAQGMEWLVLETTSHALAQHRVWGIPYSIVAMTNLTHEHLDYHGSFEKYRDAKLQLFKLCNANKNGRQIGIVNADDRYGEMFAMAIANPVSYGLKHGDLRVANLKLTPSGSTFTAKTNGDEYNIVCHLPGSFNVSNALAAIAIGRAVGLNRQQIEQGISTLKAVEGRMNRVDEGQPFEVIIDFAHTPDSFEKLFKDLRPVVKGKLICVFGSAGRRDQAKRPIQGGLAGKYCDVVVVTEEDDRDIDGHKIMNEIASGSEKAGKKKDKDLFLILDRTEAIKFAFSQAKAGDTVLLLGKGHEKTIERADGTHDWNETATATALLKKLKT